ncbi:MAG TPA: Asp-tRNA(Asn)/Glu-tRNA(Gln) amidotransferase subunit GatC [Alphaproteobacteria bacterium]|nr:Asp-tRNA(Asn)/Glu-tRNA(Gln) amidotransferase subunit GatC [Alphaproteobacteria bacterium]
MSIDKDTVGKIARLARIRVTEEDKEKLSGELTNILTMIEELNAVDTKGVDPMTSVVQVKMHQREDVVTDGDIQDKILANAPDKAAGFFVVPKVVE